MPISTDDNLYYEKLKNVIDSALEAVADGKIALSEVWIFVLVLAQAIETVVTEASDLSEEDLEQMKAAGVLLYDEYVLPLDLPGPDWLIDPLLKNGILPGVIEAAFKLAQRRLALAEEENNEDDS
jgi:hypothetical protein